MRNKFKKLFILSAFICLFNCLHLNNENLHHQVSHKVQGHFLSKVTTIAELKTQLTQANKSILFFYAIWAKPTVNTKPYFQRKCSQNGVNCIYVDFDKANELVKKYNIQALPTLIVVDKKGNTKLTKIGGTEYYIDEAINKAKL